MTNQNFIYWLEGLVENVDIEVFNEKQQKNILSHLVLVSNVERLSGFPLWLDGFMKSYELHGPKKLDKAATTLIKAELKKQIVNVMDSSGVFSPSAFERARRHPGGGVAFC